MTEPCDKNTAVSTGAACPSDEVLLGLLEGRLSEPDQAPWGRHLNSCAKCRARLEALAGDDEFRFKVARNLRESVADEQEELSHLRALLRTRTCLADAAAAANCAAVDRASPGGSARKRNRGRWLVLAASLLLAILFGVSEVTGFSRIVETAVTLLRFQTPQGTLVVEVRDPAVQVTVDSGTGELVVTGAGVHELRVRAGDRRIQATRDGKPILDEVITVTRDGREVVAVRQEPSTTSVAKQDRSAGSGDLVASSVATETASATAPAPAAVDVARTEAAEPTREPLRVQILPRDALLREAIQAERDKLPEEPSPFLVRKLEGHTGPVNNVAFAPDGKTILSCSGWPQGDRTVRLWDVDTGKEIRQFQTGAPPTDRGITGPREAPGEFYCVAFTPDGTQAIAAGEGGSVYVWDIESGAVARRFEGHPGTVYGLAVSGDGRRALSGGRDMTARLWDIQTGEGVLPMPCHNSWVRSVAISPDGWSAITGSYDRIMRLWDLETGRELREFDAKDGWVWSVAFSPSGRRAVSASGKLVRLWNLEDGKELCRYKGHLTGVTCIVFSPEGKRLLSTSYDSSVRLWDVETGEEIQVFLGHRGWVWSVAFSPDGRFAVSSGGGRDSATGGGVEPGTDFAIRLWKLP